MQYPHKPQTKKRCLLTLPLVLPFLGMGWEMHGLEKFREQQ